MLDLAFLSVRETAEIALLLFAVASYRPRAQQPSAAVCPPARDHLTAATSLRLALVAGTASGFLPGIALPFLLSIRLDAIANALLDLLFGLFLLSMALGVLATNTRLVKGIEAAMEHCVARLGWPLAVACLAALLTFRESFEIAFFASRRVADLGWAATAAAVAAGAVLVAVLPLAGLLLRIRLPLNSAFRLSALLLAWFAIGMVAGGLLTLAEAGMETLGHIGPDASAQSGGGERRLTDLDGPLRALLMIWPVTVLLRDWWLETGPVDRNRDGGRIA